MQVLVAASYGRRDSVRAPCRTSGQLPQVAHPNQLFRFHIGETQDQIPLQELLAARGALDFAAIIPVEITDYSSSPSATMRGYIFLPHSLGTKIHSSTYNSRPAPAQMNSTVNSSRHTQASIPVDRAIPPHTPPIHRSLWLRRKPFTTDATESLDRVWSVFRRRSFARLNSSSVKPPFARSSASLVSSSASDAMGTP